MIKCFTLLNALSNLVSPEEGRIVTGKELSHHFSLLIFVDIVKAGLNTMMNIGTVPVIGRIVDSLDSFLVLVRLHKHDYRIPGDLIHDGCVIQTSHEFELMVDQCCVAHLPLNRQVHQDVERIHRDYVEPLDRAWLVDDRLNVVHGNLDGFEECKRRSEAIRQL